MSVGDLLPPGAVEWLRNGERGLSSECIFGHLTGIPLAHYGQQSAPLDDGDLMRCRQLLDAVPEFRARFTEMATVSFAWAALVEHWDALCALQDNELSGLGGEGETHMRMRSIIDGAYAEYRARSKQ